MEYKTSKIHEKIILNREVVKMLRCLIDISVPENSKCAKCCIYCNEKETCENRCIGIDEWKTESNISENCIECIEM